MAQTHDLGRAFFHLIYVQPGTPPIHTAPSFEIEPPYRVSRSVVVRLPFHRALVLGWWRTSNMGEEEALLQAVSGWGIDPYDDSLDDPEVKQQIRENVAASGLDLDDEWVILSSLGVTQ